MSSEARKVKQNPLFTYAVLFLCVESVIWAKARLPASHFLRFPCCKMSCSMKRLLLLLPEGYCCTVFGPLKSMVQVVL